MIVNQGPALIVYFETAATVSGDGKRTSSWIQQDVMRTMKDHDWSIAEFPVDATSLGQLIAKISRGQLDTTRARDVLAHMVENGTSVETAITAMGIEAVDHDELESLCKELLAANPQVVEDFNAGKQQAVGSLIGQAKKKNPNANPQQVRETLIKLLSKN